MRENLTPAVLSDDVERLKEWLQKQPHLPQDVDTETLTAFVCGTKTLERAKQKLDSYFTLRSQEPRIFQFSSRDPLDQDVRKASAAYKKFFMPRPTPLGYRVFFNCVSPLFNSNFVHSQEIVRSMMLLELAMHTWPDMKGLFFVYDLKGVDASLLSKMSPGPLISAIHCFQSGYPVRLKSALVINAPPVAEVLMQRLFKPFLKAKLYERVHLTSEDSSCLNKYLPEDVLPSDYGGKEQKSSDELNDEWTSILEKKRDWFLETSMQMSDETKRPPDVKDTCGAQGTFRNLGFD